MSRTVEAILTANVAAYVSAMNRAETATGNLASTAAKAGKATQAGLDQAATSAKGVASGFQDVSRQAGISIGKAVQAGSKLRGVSAEFQKLQKVALENDQAWASVSNTLGAVGLAGAAAVGLAVKEFASFDAAMSGVASTGAEAKAQIDQLRQAALTAGADTAFSAVEAANGIEELARAGVSTADVLGGGLKGSLDLAAAGQISVADSAAIASTAMTQFKLRGKDVGHIADLLAAGAGKAMGGVDDLGMALKQGGLVASQFGLSIEETVGGLSAFAASGLLGSDAGTSLKTMLLKLASPSKEAAKLMQELGINTYDASGQFVGLESLAGQLQTAFVGQSDATRDAAMATIFGTDAIRAANVLYSEGAEGIANWTAAVDDAGYAAETAAELQNNLVGDLEKLGGSWSTLAITMGEAADGPLRAAVQALTGLLDVMGESPAAAQAVMIGTTALAGLALSAAGLMKGVSFVANFKQSLDTLAGSSRVVAAVADNLDRVGKLTGVAAIIVGIAAAGVTLAQSMKPAAIGADELANALERAATTANYDDIFRDIDGGPLVISAEAGVIAVDSLTDAIDALRKNTNRSALHPELYEDTDVAIEQFKKLDDQLKTLSWEDAAAQSKGLIDQMLLQGLTAEEVTTYLSGYADTVATMLTGLGPEWAKAAEDPQVLVDVMRGDLPEGLAMSEDGTLRLATAQDRAAEAAQAEAEAQQEAAQAAGDALKAHLDLLDAIQAVNDAQRDAANTVMGAERANANWIESLQDATKQIQENGTSLDENTEKGRKNAEYLRSLAESARDNTDAMLANGDSVDVVNGKMVQQRAEFIETIAKFGITGQAAEDLANKYGLIPNYVETAVAMPGAKLSQAEADELNRLLRDIPEKLRPEIVTIGHTQGANAAKAAIDAVRSKTVTVTVNQVIKVGSYTGYTGRYPGAMQKADGGVVDYYAAGGLRENHVAQFAPAGAWRVWAENETGGEAYIPLAASKRARSTDIWWETGRRLGIISSFATGGLTGTDERAVRAGMAGIMPLAELKAFTAALGAAARATASAAAAQKQTAAVAAAAAKRQKDAEAALKSAKATGSGTALGRAEAALKAAKATGSTTTVGRAEAALKAAKATKSTGLSKRQKAARDAKIAAAQRAVDQAKLGREKKIAAAQKQVDAEKAKREKAIAAAEKRLTAAKDAATKAADKNKAALDVLSDRQSAQADASKALADAQQELADSARNASEALQSTYMVGGDVADLLSNMAEGAANAAKFSKQIEQLRAAGLSEDLIRQIIGQGEVWGSETAADILAKGAPAIKQLNQAAEALKKATDKLGLLTAVGVRQFADGGVESHVAQIAAAGDVRVWAEPETGGEAYIPLAQSKRLRSEAILRDVAGRFGMSVRKFADGGVVTGTVAPLSAHSTQTVTYNSHYNIQLPESIRDAAQMVDFFGRAPLNLHR